MEDPADQSKYKFQFTEEQRQTAGQMQKAGACAY